MAEGQKPLEAGDIVGARFKLETLVGSGGMGTVWRATSLEGGEAVALKFLKPSDSVDESAKRRMRREAKATMAVQHPNVVQVHDVITGDDGQPIIVMQFLVGETLQKRLLKDAPLDVASFAEIFLAVTSAVGTAHAAGIVHRDLKPENIWLVTTPDGKQSPRVLDFGIAKMLGPNGTDSSGGGTLTSTGGVLGTPRYMAPEQVFGDKDIDHRADVWSVGVMAYECLSGKRPMQGDNVWQVLRAITTGDIVPLGDIAPDVPAPIAKIVTRMLSVDRNQRPDDLVDLFDALKPHTAVDAPAFPHTVAIHTEGHFVKSVQRRERHLIFFAVAVALLLGVAAVVARRPVSSAAPLPTETHSVVLASSVSAPTTPPPAVADIADASVPIAQSLHASAVARPLASASASGTPSPVATTDPFHGLAVDAPF